MLIKLKAKGCIPGCLERLLEKWHHYLCCTGAMLHQAWQCLNCHHHGLRKVLPLWCWKLSSKLQCGINVNCLQKTEKVEAALQALAVVSIDLSVICFLPVLPAQHAVDPVQFCPIGPVRYYVSCKCCQCSILLIQANSVLHDVISPNILQSSHDFTQVFVNPDRMHMSRCKKW